MATSGQEQVPVWLAPRPSHEWSGEDVARFLQEMGLRDSVAETFKRKRDIADLSQSMKLTTSSQKRSMERCFYSAIGLKMIYLTGMGKCVSLEGNGE